MIIKPHSSKRLGSGKWNETSLRCLLTLCFYSSANGYECLKKCFVSQLPQTLMICLIFDYWMTSGRLSFHNPFDNAFDDRMDMWRLRKDTKSPDVCIQTKDTENDCGKLCTCAPRSMVRIFFYFPLLKFKPLSKWVSVSTYFEEIW